MSGALHLRRNYRVGSTAVSLSNPTFKILILANSIWRERYLAGCLSTRGLLHTLAALSNESLRTLARLPPANVPLATTTGLK